MEGKEPTLDPRHTTEPEQMFYAESPAPINILDEPPVDHEAATGLQTVVAEYSDNDENQDSPISEADYLPITIQTPPKKQVITSKKTNPPKKNAPKILNNQSVTPDLDIKGGNQTVPYLSAPFAEWRTRIKNTVVSIPSEQPGEEETQEVV